MILTCSVVVGGRERREVGWPSVSVMFTMVFSISGVLGVCRADSAPVAGTFRPHLSLSLVVSPLLLIVAESEIILLLYS